MTIKYLGKINTQNKNNSHTIALDFALDHGKQRMEILEVGCSTGYFGESLRAAGHRVTGVEPNSAAAAEAGTKLDFVFNGTLDSFFSENPKSRFDVIVFGDVLEHLPEPLNTLTDCKKALKPGGRIVCSVPNVTHLSIRTMVASGTWKYSEKGILDNTHLRFFDLEEIVKIFTASGYKIESFQSVRIPYLDACQICDIEPNEALAESLLKETGDRRAEDFQYVLSATPSESAATDNSRFKNIQTLRIVALTDKTEQPIFDIRLKTPLKEWAERNYAEIRPLAFHEFDLPTLEWGDAFILQRGANEKAERIAEILKKSGKPYIYEVDDLLFGIPDFLSHHQKLIRNKEIIKKLISQSQAVTTTTARLADQIRPLNANVLLAPNYAAPRTSHPEITNREEDKTVTLVIAASDNVLLDFIAEPLIQIQKEFGTSVRIISIGVLYPRLKEIGLSVEDHGLLSRDAFCDLLKSLPSPIGIIPLDDSLFSSCKSAVKYFDYTQCGVVSICSNHSPYSDVIKDGSTGLLVDNNDAAWLDALRRLINDTPLRRALLQGALKEVEAHYSLRNTVEAWGNILENFRPSAQKIRASATTPKKTVTDFRFTLFSLLGSIQKINRKRLERRRYVKATSFHKG